MRADWVPSKDSDLSQWLSNFVAVLTPNVALFGLTAQDVTVIETEKGTFDDAVADQAIKQTSAVHATTVKRTARTSLDTSLRSLVRRIQNHPAMTNDLRAALGLPVRSDVRPASAGWGEEVPAIALDSQPGRIIVHFGTDPTNEQVNGKPSWARGCNIYRKTVDEADFRLIAFETASPYVDRIVGPAADYTYIVEYRGTKATDVGAPSIAATIAASGLLAA